MTVFWRAYIYAFHSKRVKAPKQNVLLISKKKSLFQEILLSISQSSHLLAFITNILIP